MLNLIRIAPISALIDIYDCSSGFVDADYSSDDEVVHVGCTDGCMILVAISTQIVVRLVDRTTVAVELVSRFYGKPCTCE